MKIYQQNIPLNEGSLDAKAITLWLKIKSGDETALRH